MPVELTPVSAVTPDAPSYLTVQAALALAARLQPPTTAFAAATAQQQADALAAATARVDRLQYQGRKCLDAQTLSFPRTPYPDYGDGLANLSYPYPGGVRDGFTSRPRIWDFDDATNTPVVPRAVLQAVLIEADAILAGDAHTRRREERDGLTGQSVGGASESYATPAAAGGGGGGGWGAELCPRARAMLEPYRLRTGRLL